MTPRDDRPPQDDEVAFDASLERKREARKSGSEAEVRQRRDADFPEDDEEDSQTARFLMGDDLIFQSWHSVDSFVRVEA